MTASPLLDWAERRRDDGLDRVEARAGRWVDRMRWAARDICRRQGSVTADDLRRHADATKDQPHHPNSWGAIFRGAEWRCVGYTQSRYLTNNARRISVWRLHG